LDCFDTKTGPPGLHLYTNEKRFFWNTLVSIHLKVKLLSHWSTKSKKNFSLAWPKLVGNFCYDATSDS